METKGKYNTKEKKINPGYSATIWEDSSSVHRYSGNWSISSTTQVWSHMKKKWIRRHNEEKPNYSTNETERISGLHLF